MKTGETVTVHRSLIVTVAFVNDTVNRISNALPNVRINIENMTEYEKYRLYSFSTLDSDMNLPKQKILTFNRGKLQ